MLEEVRPGVIVVGTAHVSPQSVAEVEEAIRTRRPRRVLVELDPRRLEALKDPEAWQKTDIIRVLREKKQHLFLLQLYLAAMQAQVGRDTGVAPGTELLRAVQVADEVGAEVVLIDRDVSVTLRRGFAAMGFWARLRLFWKVWMQVLTPAIDKAPVTADGKLDVAKILETDAITQMTEEFARFAPQLKVALIDERDAYMASHIAEQADQVRAGPGADGQRGPGADGQRGPGADGQRGPGDDGQPGAGIVAVVGAGHMPGIRAHLASGRRPERAPLDLVPVKRFGVGKAIGWGIPAAFVAVFVYLAWTAQYDTLGREILYFWLVTGGLSAVGCMLALGHPLSILTAFLAAPVGVLHPLIATGWFAGLVEAKMRTPTVADFQAIKTAESFGAFWKNGVVRILLVTALTNIGAMVAAGIVAGKYFHFFAVFFKWLAGLFGEVADGVGVPAWILAILLGAALAGMAALTRRRA